MNRPKFKRPLSLETEPKKLLAGSTPWWKRNIKHAETSTKYCDVCGSSVVMNEGYEMPTHSYEPEKRYFCSSACLKIFRVGVV